MHNQLSNESSKKLKSAVNRTSGVSTPVCFYGLRGLQPKLHYFDLLQTCEQHVKMWMCCGLSIFFA